MKNTKTQKQYAKTQKTQKQQKNQIDFFLLLNKIELARAQSLLKATLKGLTYRRLQRQRKHTGLLNCLKYKNVTLEQYNNIDKIRSDLHDAQNWVKNPSLTRFSKSAIHEQNEWINTLEQLINNIEFVKSRMDSIPDMILAPKRRYKTLFNNGFLNIYNNVLQHLKDDHYIESFTRLGYCNKTLQNNTLSIIQNYIHNYFNDTRMSIGKDLIVFQYYSVFFKACETPSDTTLESPHHCCLNYCPTIILFNISRAGTWPSNITDVDHDLKRLIYNTLKKRHCSKLIKNHGIVL